MPPRSTVVEEYRGVSDTDFFENLQKKIDIRSWKKWQPELPHMTTTRCNVLVRSFLRCYMICAKLAIVRVDKNFGMLVGDILNEVKKSVDRSFDTAETDKIPVV